MAGYPHFLDMRRLIDRNGVASGGEIYFYLTGTTVLAPIYADLNLTTPMANPVVLDAAATIPQIFLDKAVTYRRQIIYPDGVVDNVDPYLSIEDGGSDSTDISYQSTGSAKLQTVFDKIDRRIDLEDFMYVGDSSASVGLQRAFDYVKTNGGGTIYINGSYTYAASVLYESIHPIALEGRGAAELIHNSTDDSHQTQMNYTGTGEFLAFEGGPVDGNFINGLSIKHLSVYTADQPTRTSGGGAGIAIRAAGGYVIEDVTVVGFADGILFDDNPRSQSVSNGGTIGTITHVNISRNADHCMWIRGHVEIDLFGCRFYNETIAGLYANLRISQGTRGQDANAIHMYGGACIGTQVRPQYNVCIDGNAADNRFNGVAFERSAVAGVFVSQPSPEGGDSIAAAFTDCWWNDHQTRCGDFYQARVFVLQPRASCVGTEAAFRFRGATANANIGGGVFGGHITFLNNTGVDVLNASGVSVLGTTIFCTSGAARPAVSFGSGTSNCHAGGIVRVLNTAPTNMVAGNYMTGKCAFFSGTLDGSGAANFLHGIPNANNYGISVRGYALTAGNAAVPLTWVYTDGSNTSINTSTSPQPGRPYYCYMEQQS